MSDHTATRPSVTDSTTIDWTNPEAPAIDGFTVAEIVQMAIDSLVPARCAECEAEHHIEPDAEGYDCQECHAPGSVTSPLVKLGFI